MRIFDVTIYEIDSRTNELISEIEKHQWSSSTRKAVDSVADAYEYEHPDRYFEVHCSGVSRMVY